MPFFRLDLVPTPVFEGRSIWCEIVGARIIDGDLVLYIRTTAPQGTVTFYATVVSYAYSDFP